jgi:hypothetical protein
LKRLLELAERHVLSRYFEKSCFAEVDLLSEDAEDLAPSLTLVCADRISSRSDASAIAARAIFDVKVR